MTTFITFLVDLRQLHLLFLDYIDSKFSSYILSRNFVTYFLSANMFEVSLSLAQRALSVFIRSPERDSEHGATQLAEQEIASPRI